MFYGQQGLRAESSSGGNSSIPKLNIYPNAELFAAQHSGIKFTRRILELSTLLLLFIPVELPLKSARELPNKRFLQFGPTAHEQPRMDVLVAS